MLTQDQLAQIKEFLHDGPSPWLSDTMVTYELLQHLSDLINEVERLQLEVERLKEFETIPVPPQALPVLDLDELDEDQPC